MKQILTDDAAMVETMKRMLKHFGASINVEELADGRFRLSVSDEEIAKVMRQMDPRLDVPD